MQTSSGQTILTRAELEAHDPEGGRGGRWLCPLPACAGHTGKNHRSLDVVRQGQKEGMFYCHRCKAKGQLKDYWKDFVPMSPREKEREARARRDQARARRLEEIGQRFRNQGPPLSAAALVALSSAGQAPALVQPATTGSARTVHPELKEVLYRAGTLQALDTPEARAFLATRGFAEFTDILTRARVRFAPDFGRREATQEKRAYQGAGALVFPISDDAGQLVAFQGRRIAPGDGLKVLTFGPKTGGVFWGPGALEAWQEGSPLALCEAPLDALTLAVCQVPAVALCGSSAPPEFLTSGCFGRRYWLAFDADDAGDQAAKVIGSELLRFGGIVERLRPTEAKDWNEALQAGGAVWDRTAAALRALIAREAKATTTEGERSGDIQRKNQSAIHEENQSVIQRKNQTATLPELGQVETAGGGSKRIETESPSLELEEVGKVSPLQLQQDATVPPHTLRQTETENQQGNSWKSAGENLKKPEISSKLEQNGTGNQAALFPDHREELLLWAAGQARAGLLPEPSGVILLPSGQHVAEDGAALWLLDKLGLAARLQEKGHTSPDAFRAFLIVRADLLALARWCADAWRWLHSPRTHRGACCLLPSAVEELRQLASEFEALLPEAT